MFGLYQDDDLQEDEQVYDESGPSLIPSGRTLARMLWSSEASARNTNDVCLTALDRGKGCYITKDLDKNWKTPSDTPESVKLRDLKSITFRDPKGHTQWYGDVQMIRHDLVNAFSGQFTKFEVGLTCPHLARAIKAIEASNPRLVFAGANASSTVEYDFRIQMHTAKMFYLSEMLEHVDYVAYKHGIKMPDDLYSWNGEKLMEFMKTVPGVGNWIRTEEDMWFRNADVDISMPGMSSWRQHFRSLVQEFLASPATVLSFIGRFIEPEKAYKGGLTVRVKTYASNFLTRGKNMHEGGHRVSFIIDKTHRQMFFYEPLRTDIYMYMPSKAQLGYEPTFGDGINIVEVAFLEITSVVPELATFQFLRYPNTFTGVREQNNTMTMETMKWPTGSERSPMFRLKRKLSAMGTNFQPNEYQQDYMNNLASAERDEIFADWVGGYCGLFNLFTADLIARNPQCSPGQIVMWLMHLSETTIFGVPLLTPIIRSFAIYVECLMTGAPMKMTMFDESTGQIHVVEYASKDLPTAAFAVYQATNNEDLSNFDAKYYSPTSGTYTVQVSGNSEYNKLYFKRLGAAKSIATNLGQGKLDDLKNLGRIIKAPVEEKINNINLAIRRRSTMRRRSPITSGEIKRVNTQAVPNQRPRRKSPFGV